MVSYSTTIPAQRIVDSRLLYPNVWLVVGQIGLVTIAAERVLNRPLKLGFQNFGTAQLSYFLSWFADGQMARTRFAVFDFACRSQTESLLG